jgi:pyridoxal 5'-phosphate synthase pdxT subunit
LALQGAFLEHRQMLSRLGVESFEVRQQDDWLQPKDGLIIPGGESTVQSKLLSDLSLRDVIKHDIEAGLPVFGTCAGLIILAKRVEGQSPTGLSTMDITVCRNAYGRQLGSFFTEAAVEGIGENIPMTFIRAPYIKSVSGNAKALAAVGGRIIAAQEGNQLVTAFHPELTDDTRVHEYFLRMARK